MNFNYNHSEQSLSVSEVNRYVKALMDNDALLSSVSVRGEISNLKYHTSGHLYFTLKDEDAEIAAVMFRSSVNTMRFSAKNGMKVTAYGRISVYEKGGKCQMYVSAMTDDGKGQLQQEYERLLKKLTEEGLFSQERKRALPKIPKCIGIITSPTGAAVRDMINVTGRRWPMAKILLYPSLVQGEEASQSLCNGLECLNALQECDVIIIGRGGGSIEDLWAFNDERVVRMVAASKIPVISAVGHETDFTLCDFAADFRAPTPSAAAEVAVPDRVECKMRLDDAFLRVDASLKKCLFAKTVRLENMTKQLSLASPVTRVSNEKKTLSFKLESIERSMREVLRKNQDRFKAAIGRLEAVNPLAVLSRGYSVTKNIDGEILNSVSRINEGDELKIIFADGSADAKVTSISQK